MRACPRAPDDASRARCRASREPRAASTARAPRRPFRPPGEGLSPDPPRRHCAAIDKDPIGPHARNLPPEERQLTGGLRGLRESGKSGAALRLLLLVAVI